MSRHKYSEFLILTGTMELNQALYSICRLLYDSKQRLISLIIGCHSYAIGTPSGLQMNNGTTDSNAHGSLNAPHYFHKSHVFYGTLF